MNIDIKKVKWVIPVLAIFVIFESVLIVQKLTKSEKVDLGGLQVPSKTTEVPAKEEKSVNLYFTGSQSVSLSQESEVKVEMATLKDYSLDSIDVLVEYDPEYLEVLGTDPSDKFSYLGRNWVEPDKKRVLVSMVETELPDGVKFNAGEQVTLVALRFMPLKAGQTTLRIYGETDGVGTVLAENGTAEKVPYAAESFVINID